MSLGVYQLNFIVFIDKKLVIVIKDRIGSTGVLLISHNVTVVITERMKDRKPNGGRDLKVAIIIVLVKPRVLMLDIMRSIWMHNCSSSSEVLEKGIKGELKDTYLEVI